ncbi:acyltransferase family protein [Curtobacterium sp. YR515]|uniref:acyltransferase family protein n=1 Tax=Curtobacterium sp. YR515 TaxID=1855316 RepID=UPI0008E5116B|nr:acyltransferase family protein [Curtobacterium sp. YR515]SFF35280.1 Fucose 4-O-acetylase [Curtobacterium sp. YR515]
MTSPRLLWIDLAKGATVTSVLVMHSFAFAITLTGTSSPAAEKVLWLLELMNMPVMFLLAGLLSAGALEHRPGRFVTTRLRGVVWPLVIWFGLSVVFDTTLGGENALDQSPDPAQSAFWFLVVLAGVSGLAVLVRRLPATPVAVVAVVVAMLLGAVDGPRHLFTDFGTPVAIRYGFAACYFVGIAIARSERWSIGSVATFRTAGLACSGLVAFIAVLFVAGVPGRSISESIATVPTMLALSVAQLAVFAVLPRIRVLEWLGEHSIVVYVMHVVVFQHIVGGLVGAGLSPWTAATIAVVAMMVLVVVTSWLRERQPAVAALFTFPQRSRRVSPEHATRAVAPVR